MSMVTDRFDRQNGILKPILFVNINLMEMETGMVMVRVIKWALSTYDFDFH